ncbi:MAG: biopolymer transporter ExbD [Chitinophagaceae bacterium]
MNIRRKSKEGSEVDTGPLNDILFILVMFFLIVSTLANPNIVQVNNPRGKSDSKAKQTIVVSINKDNLMFLGTKEIPASMLDSVIKFEVDKMKLTMDTPSVVINADTISYTGGFYRVMVAAKRNGAKVVMNVKN